MKRKLALLAVLGAVVFVWFQRGVRTPVAAQRLGAEPAPIATAYQTEHAWTIRDTASDISEMAEYGGLGRESGAVPEAVLPWHPETFVAYATAQIGAPRSDAWNEHDPADQHERLLAMTPDALLRSNTEVTAALKRDMRNPHAHEAAALLLGTFALRESAWVMTDTRWALNRMTAHLAVSQALRGAGSSAGAEGQLAHAMLLALSDRQRSAMAVLDAVPGDTPAIAAWRRALRMRLTQDWRLLTAPATSSRLEKLEYFRARRHTVSGVRAGQELTDMREPVAVDFARIVPSRSYGVDDGQTFIVDGLAGELEELSYVYKQFHQRELPPALPAEAVNARATRLVNGRAIQVLPWGAWAEFHQRHIGMSIGQIDRLYRQTLGLPDRADQMKRDLDAALGHLTMYPVASTWRLKGQRGTEADLTHLSRAIDVAVRAPELIAFECWAFLELGSRYEPVSRAVPALRSWFVPPSPDVPYDASRRADTLLGALKPPAIEALMDESRFTIGLFSRVMQRLKGNRQLMTKVRELVEPRVDYDMWAIEYAITLARDTAERVSLRQRACGLAVSQCLELASELAESNEAAAAAEYEKAFRNPALDEVAMANSSRWLVSYYERNGQLPKAMDLAERAAATGSARGMLTLARLFERRARLAEADELFKAVATRYPRSKPDLAAFLYRQAIDAKRSAYADRWKAIERELFPSGLQALPATMPERPANGVFVEEDSYWSRQVRLQAGDIIVGVDGWKVESLDQYQTIVAFSPVEARHKFTAWRGVLFTVDLSAAHGMTLKTHPLQGWIE